MSKSTGKVGKQQVSFEKLVKELEIEKKVFADKNVENAQKQRQLDQLLKQYNALKKYLDGEKKTILNTAKIQAKELVKTANQRTIFQLIHSRHLHYLRPCTKLD